MPYSTQHTFAEEFSGQPLVTVRRAQAKHSSDEPYVIYLFLGHDVRNVQIMRQPIESFLVSCYPVDGLGIMQMMQTER
jgi:hypothetical protein